MEPKPTIDFQQIESRALVLMDQADEGARQDSPTTIQRAEHELSNLLKTSLRGHLSTAVLDRLFIGIVPAQGSISDDRYARYLQRIGRT